MNGLPYPEPTDDLRDGADAIKALAEGIDSALWQDRLAVVPEVGTGEIWIQRSGPVVFLVADTNYLAPALPNGQTRITALGAVPADMLAAGNIMGAASLSGTQIGHVVVAPTGGLYIRNLTGVTRDCNGFSAIWMLSAS